MTTILRSHDIGAAVRYQYVWEVFARPQWQLPTQYVCKVGLCGVETITELGPYSTPSAAANAGRGMIERLQKEGAR